jgi:hypothetical protein
VVGLIGQHAAAALPTVTKVKDKLELVARPDRRGHLHRACYSITASSKGSIFDEPDPPPAG